MAVHHQLRAVTQQYGGRVLLDAEQLRQMLTHSASEQAAPYEVELICETVQWAGLPRLTEAVNRGAEPADAIAVTGDAIARERSSSDVAGTRWALAVLAFAAGHLPESEVERWAPPRKPSKTPFLIAAAALVALALIGGGIWLAASGDDERYDEQAYCDAYRVADETVNSINLMQLDSAAYDDFTQQVEQVRNLAPLEMRDEWDTLIRALDEFEQILEDAGLSLDDLQGFARGELPEGVSFSTLQELGTRMQEFAEQAGFQTAGDRIDQDAETRCN